MTRNITRLFDSYQNAAAAVDELERSGVPHHDISIISNKGEHDGDLVRHAGHDHPADHAGEAAEDAGKGAGIGGLVGGAGGLLAGLGMLAIPGLGPVVAAGWLASTAVGAVVGAAAGGAVGGLVGALTESGVPREDAEVYAEGVRRGGTLVSVRIKDDDDAGRIQTILNRFNAADATTRRTSYEERGWSRFDDDATPYTDEEIRAERARYSAGSIGTGI